MFKVLFSGIVCCLSLFMTLYSAESSSTQEINDRFQKFTDAVNQGNASVLSSFWTDDAEIVKPTAGIDLQGKQAIEEYLQKTDKELKDRNLNFSFKVGTITFPSPDTAIVEGAVEITDKNGALLQRNARRVELIKQNGDWFIKSVSEIEVPPPPPLYAHLKELSWLVGNWIDKDENVTISFNTHWDKFKNFIFQHFQMIVYGMDAMEGLQIIGWDPIKNTFRSWVYDSDGGFGTGLWSKNGDKWQVALDYVLSDGTKASGINIYKKINDNSYSFSSIDRKVNGEAVPDVAPVTVNKEK